MRLASSQPHLQQFTMHHCQTSVNCKAQFKVDIGDKNVCSIWVFKNSEKREEKETINWIYGNEILFCLFFFIARELCNHYNWGYRKSTSANPFFFEKKKSSHFYSALILIKGKQKNKQNKNFFFVFNPPRRKEASQTKSQLIYWKPIGDFRFYLERVPLPKEANTFCSSSLNFKKE